MHVPVDYIRTMILARLIPDAWFLVLLLVCGLTGCVPQFIAVNDLHRLAKGMPREQVLDELPRSPTQTRSFTANGKTWVVYDHEDHPRSVFARVRFMHLVQHGRRKSS
jgi:hypothetical protein